MGPRFVTRFCIQPLADLRPIETDSDDGNDKSYKYRDPVTSEDKSSPSASEEPNATTAQEPKSQRPKKKKAKVSELIDINGNKFANFAF
jgi:hypothetical protein